jgi:thymidine kinase
MNSSKTANMLMVAHNYSEQNKLVLLIKPKMEQRFKKEYIVSRAAKEKQADFFLDSDNNQELIEIVDKFTYSCVLVDEAQFLTSKNIDTLKLISMKTPVICYGLRTTYEGFLFEGSKRLMEITESIEEIKTICTTCEHKAIMNAKIVNGRVVKSGSTVIELGDICLYKPLCWKCWYLSTL